MDSYHQFLSQRVQHTDRWAGPAGAHVETSDERTESLARLARCRAHAQKLEEKRRRKKERQRLEAESECAQYCTEGPVIFDEPPSHPPGNWSSSSERDSNTRRQAVSSSRHAGTDPSLPRSPAPKSAGLYSSSRPLPHGNYAAGMQSSSRSRDAGYHRTRVPLRGPIAKRPMRITSEWQRTMGQIRRSIPTPELARLRGTRKEKMKTRRKERKRLRRGGEMQIEWFKSQVMQIISRYPVTELEGKPPIYDYITALYRESKRHFGDWVAKLREHYEKTQTVWRHQYDVMDQVRKLEDPYMENTARYLLRFSYLESSLDRLDNLRAIRLKEQVERQREEFQRFTRRTKLRFQL